VSSESEIAIALASSRAIIARGLGRSYGDAAQVSGGTVLRSRIGDIGQSMTKEWYSLVRVRHSTNYLARALPRDGSSGDAGYSQVTIGGAIAATYTGRIIT